MRYYLVIIFIICIGFFSACSVDNKNNETQVNSQDSNQIYYQQETSVLSKEDQDEVKKECLKTAQAYSSLYQSSTKSQVDWKSSDYQLAEESIQTIRKALLDKKISVMKKNADQTTSLINSEDFYSFWEKVNKGLDASFQVYEISEDGGFFYSKFCQINQQKSVITAYMHWNDKDKAIISEGVSSDILDWIMTEKGNFIYNLDSNPTLAFDSHMMIRIAPIDEMNLSYCQKYVKPFGYQGNNLFIINWSENDFSSLNFNDLFEYVYYLLNYEYIDPDQYLFQDQNLHWYIPAEEFEQKIQRFFAVNRDDLKINALYDKTLDAYPWETLLCQNYHWDNPYMFPEVVKIKKNVDETFTLTIDAISLAYNTDQAFTHELTIRQLPDNQFQYVSNIVLPNENNILPFYFPRLDEQQDIQQKNGV